MRRQIASFALMVWGIIALVGGFTMLPSPALVSAQAPQPSPRPTLQPTPDLRQRDRKPTAVVPGRLTGTIIDLRTGAPTAGIAVMVDDQKLSSDANGNYDIWLPSGYYMLSLEPTEAQGVSIQPPQQVAVGPGDTVVVHLFFTSPAPTAVAEAAAPTAVAPTPTVVPSPAVAAPPSLPDTSVAHTSAARPLADSLGAPASLPTTAAPTGLGSPGGWLLFGALMLGLGALIQLTPRRRVRTLRRPPPRPDALLRDLLRDDVVPARQSGDEDVLADLLGRDL